MHEITQGSMMACIVALVASSASAAILTSGAVGTAAPPAMLGTYLMKAFPDDTQPEVAIVTSVPSPLGGTVAFSPSVEHFDIPVGWGSWSHGYGGDVYWTMTAHQVTLTLPAGTKAFYFYAEPNPLPSHRFTATAQDGTSLTQSAAGTGAAVYFGFHATGASTIQTIQVTSDTDFAVGEFGIANASSPSADLDGDGDVDGIDLAMLLGAWTGAASYAPCPPLNRADLNGDCKVNGLDLALMLGLWG